MQFFRSYVIAALLILLSAGCAPVKPENPEPETADIQNIGTVYSPDGKYFIEGYGVDYEAQVSGHIPVRQIRIVEADSGEMVWSMDGLFLLIEFIPFAWSSDSRYVYIAYAGRIWKEGLIVDTTDMSEQPLPGISELAKYYADTTPDSNRSDPYIVPNLWLDEHRAVVSFSWRVTEKMDIEDDRQHGEYVYDADRGEFCVQAPAASETVLTLYTAHLTDDGSAHRIMLDTSDLISEQVYRLMVADTDGRIIWEAQAAQPHAGWNSLFLIRADGRDCLMRYNPAIYQGSCSFSFHVFYLDSDGNEIVVDKDEVEFSINPDAWASSSEPPDTQPIKAFYEHINQYLPTSELLLNTDLYIVNLLPEEQKNRFYGTEDAPVSGLRDYFYENPDLDFERQVELLIQSFQ